MTYLPPLPKGITDHKIIGHDGPVFTDIDLQVYAISALQSYIEYLSGDLEVITKAIKEVVEAADEGGWEKLSPGLENQRHALDLLQPPEQTGSNT